MPLLPAAAALAVTVVLGAFSCEASVGGPSDEELRKVLVENIQSELPKQLEERNAGFEITVASVVCTKGEDTGEGDTTFGCTATGTGTSPKGVDEKLEIPIDAVCTDDACDWKTKAE